MKRLLIILILTVLQLGIYAQQKIPMHLEESGIYTIPCEVNGLKLRFVFDTGASDVHLSLVEAAFMLKNGYISPNDFIGKGKYSMADGSISENSIVNLKEIKIGNVVINNVSACISSNIKASLLLGQSAIRKLGPYSINGDYLVLDNHSTKELNGFKTVNDINGNVYTGFVVNGIYEGQGKMTYANGETYEGDWRLGKRNGKGILRYKNGKIKYDGEWKEDKRHGYGSSYGIIGNRYEGFFSNDKNFGKGTYYNSNGDSTVAISTDYYSCKGTRYYKNGETITGEWVKGYKEGKFVHKYPNGNIINEYYKKDSLVSTKIIQGNDYKSVSNTGANSFEHFTGKSTKSFPEGKYSGDFVNGRREGYGTMTYSDGAIYKGSWEYDRMEGKGTYTWKDGDKYTGDFHNGWREGSGIYTWSNGDKYVGSFERSKRSGKGKMTYTSGGSYDGEWEDGKWNGKGTITYSNGDLYNGELKNGSRHGNGIIYYSTGNQYEGNWVDDVFSGTGTYTWKSGDRYVGSFLKGKKQGYGTYTWKNGDKYIGYWDNNLQHGEGELLYANGESKTGEGTNGHFVGNNSSGSTKKEYPSYESSTYTDEQTIEKYVPKEFYTAYVTTTLNLREEPNTDCDIIERIPEGEYVFMESSERYKNFSKVMSVKSGNEGYVSSKYLDGYTKVKINNKGALEVTGKTDNKYAEINLKNEANVTAKITIGNKNYDLPPYSTKKIKYIEGGTYNIMASSPGIIPYVGVDTVEGGYEYSWRFYIQTVKR